MTNARLVFRGRTRRQRRALIEQIVTTWRERLLLEHWSFEVLLLREPPADVALARITVNERYNDGLIEIHPEFWLQTKSTQSRVLLHEIVHALTNRLSVVGARAPKRTLELIDAEENLTEHITNIVWDAYEEQP